MANVCFFFEPTKVDIFSGCDESLHAWNNAIKAAGDINRLAVIDTDGGFKQFDQDLDTEVYFEMGEFLSNESGSMAVVDVPWNANTGTSLWDFDHNVDWYVFGPAAGWAGQTENALFIPQAGQGALHAVHIASIIMLHRFSVIGGT